MAASCVAGVGGLIVTLNLTGSLPETTPRSSLGSTPISSPQRKLESPAWQATGVTWGYPSFRWGDGLGVRCDSLLSVLAVSRQVSAVRRLASGVRPYTWRIQRTALCGRHSACRIRPGARFETPACIDIGQIPGFPRQHPADCPDRVRCAPKFPPKRRAKLVAIPSNPQKSRCVPGPLW